MPSRRAFLTSGAAAVVVVGMGAAALAHGPGLQRARAPWFDAGQNYDDARLAALSYAILAPNPHNRQPWWFELVGDNGINIFCDLDRRLPHTDPFNRQITIGFGCMIELLVMAAGQLGYDAVVTPFPDGTPEPHLDARRIAHVTFARSPEIGVDPLFQSVLARRSSKDPYDPQRPVSADVLQGVITASLPQSAISGSVDPGSIDALNALTWEGWMIEYETAVTRRESIDLMRIGNRAIDRDPDGIDLSGIAMGVMNTAGIVTRETLDTPGSTAYQQGIDMYRAIIESAQGHTWITTRGNRRTDQLQAGRDWVRLNLSAQAAGLGIHPLSQVLQEFDEMADPYARTHARLAPEGGTIQMLARVGYGTFSKPSPRWPLNTRLILPEE